MPYYADEEEPDPEYRRLSGVDALRRLLRLEDELDDAEWNFVTGCARFRRLSEKQEECLISTLEHIEIRMKAEQAKRNRLRRKRNERSR